MRLLLLALVVHISSDRRKPRVALSGPMLPTRLRPIDFESSPPPRPPSHRHHTHTSVPFMAHDFLEGGPI